MEYNLALSEWLKTTTNKPLPLAFEDFKIRPDLYHETTGDGVCTCGKRHLKRVYVIEYLPDGTTYNIGSSCILRFSEEYDNTNILIPEYSLAHQNLQDMTRFVITTETNIRNSKAKGKCIVCSAPTVGKNTEKAKTNYFHYCKKCVSVNNRRRCIGCLQFGHDITAPLYKRLCYRCYLSPNNML